MLGPEGEVGTKNCGRGIDGGAGALAQAEKKSSSEKQAHRRMRVRSFKLLAVTGGGQDQVGDVLCV